jgi:glycogen synthase
MRIHARDLTVGDIIQVNDWHLHVTSVERATATAIVTTEVSFPIHFADDEFVTIHERAAAA